MTMIENMETIPCLQNKSRILIIGDPFSKRTDYFTRAAAGLGIEVQCVEWNQVRERQLAPSLFVKIDPPASMGARVDEIEAFAGWYERELKALQQQESIRFLTAPTALCQTFDKAVCKRRLNACGIETTAMVDEPAGNFEQLRVMMKRKGLTSLFVKPKFGSGAAGILAYRCHPGRQEEIAYTSMIQAEDGSLYNTKKLNRMTDSAAIARMADRLLKQPVVLEEWEHKAVIHGVSFDIRAVWQFGRLDYLVARGSKGPITNLHLNNGAIPIEDLGFSAAQWEAVESLCRRTAACFEGLSSAGIDILMTPKGRFKVIEVNGQGDLIYQDIYGHNTIYRRQIEEGVKRYGAGAQ